MSLRSIRKDTHEHIYTTQSDDCYEMLWNRKAKVTESCKRFHICLYLHDQHPPILYSSKIIGYWLLQHYSLHKLFNSHVLSVPCSFHIVKHQVCNEHHKTIPLCFTNAGVVLEFTQTLVLNNSYDSWQCLVSWRCFVSTIKHNTIKPITLGNLFITVEKWAIFKESLLVLKKWVPCYSSLSWQKSQMCYFEPTYRAR